MTGLIQPFPYTATERRARELAPSFRARDQVAAFLVARAAPMYASIDRVLREIKATIGAGVMTGSGMGAGAGAGWSGTSDKLMSGIPRRSGFRPSSVLDYGARAGCGLWAVNQVKTDHHEALEFPRAPKI